MGKEKQIGKSVKAVKAVAGKAAKLKPIPKKIGASKMITMIVEAKNRNATKKKKKKSAIASYPKLDKLTKKELLDLEAYEEKQGRNFRYVTMENIHRMPNAYSMWVEGPQSEGSVLKPFEYSFEKIVAMKSVFFIDAKSIPHVHHLAFVQLPKNRLKFKDLNSDIQKQIITMVESTSTGYTFTRQQSIEDPTGRYGTGDVLQSLVPSELLMQSILNGGTDGDLEVEYMPYPVNVYNLSTNVQIDLMDRYSKGEFDKDFPITAIHNYATPASSTAPRWIQAYPSWSAWFLLFFHAGMADKCKYNDGDLGHGWNAHVVQASGLAWEKIFVLDVSQFRRLLYLNYTVTTLSCSYIYTHFDAAALAHLITYDRGKDVYITQRQYPRIIAINGAKDTDIFPKFQAQIRKSEWGHVKPKEPERNLSIAQALLQSPADQELVHCYCGGFYNSTKSWYRTRHFSSSKEHRKIQCPDCKVERTFYAYGLPYHRLNNHNPEHKYGCDNCLMTFELKKGRVKHKKCEKSQRPDYTPPRILTFVAATPSSSKAATAAISTGSTKTGFQVFNLTEVAALQIPSKTMKIVKRGATSTRTRVTSPVAGPSFMPPVRKETRRKRVIDSDKGEDDDDSHIRNIERITLDELPLHTALSITPAGEIVVLPKVVEEQTTGPTCSLDPLLARYLAAQEISVRSSVPIHPVDRTPAISGLVKPNKATLESAGLTVSFNLNATGVTEKVISPNNI